ncbi:amidohydrolase family protein [Saccharopolyspora sp. MS10]|uniref:amidohydrolase family protein n=1 Tax=Saccharopolyspora sp. MS10 TaxID=3385973 RepID=UPI0039A28F17
MSPRSGPPLDGAIDVHAHYVTPRLRAAMVDAGHAEPDGMPAIPDWSPESALADMDSLGVATALLSVSSPGVHFGSDADARRLARDVNTEGAEIAAARPDRFGLLASLPLPDVTGALAEVEHAFDALGADGITLHTHYDGKHLGHPEHEPLLSALDERAAVVVLHPTSPPCWEAVSAGLPRPLLEFPFETTRAVASLVLSGALERHPRIRFVVPHAGAALPVLADRIAAFSLISGGPPIDVAGALRGLHYDLAGFALPRQLPALLALADPDRLLYGSDLPFTPAPVARGLAEALAADATLTAEQQRSMRRGAAEALFPRFARPGPPGAAEPRPDDRSLRGDQR